MKRLLPLLLLYFSPAYAVPVVLNFSQGSLNSTTRTTSNITETIVSTDYNSGNTYSIMGTNISIDGSTMAPSPSTTTQTIDGTSYTWTGADLTTKPNVTITNPGQAFQYTESYIGPGLSNRTVIQRTTIIESVTESTSVFSQ
jgi:hypothetical protein